MHWPDPWSRWNSQPSEFFSYKTKLAVLNEAGIAQNKDIYKTTPFSRSRKWSITSLSRLSESETFPIISSWRSTRDHSTKTHYVNVTIKIRGWKLFVFYFFKLLKNAQPCNVTRNLGGPEILYLVPRCPRPTPCLNCFNSAPYRTWDLR